MVTAGQGGVVVFDVTDPTAPDTRGYIGAGGAGLQRYYHVLPARPGLAWATGTSGCTPSTCPTPTTSPS